MNQTATALVLLTIVLAGCTTLATPDVDLDELTSTETSVLSAFMTPTNVGARVGEPGFRVGPDGTIWVHAPGGLWKSTNGGTSFTDVTSSFFPGVVVGGDADLAIGSDGSLYYTDLEMLAAISVFSSHDNGTSWFENPIASQVPGDDRQWIEAGPDAGPLSLGGEAVYLVFNNLPTNVYMTKSIDGGKTWFGKNVVLTTPQTDFWSMGNIVIDSDGTIFVVYALGNALQPVGDNVLPIDYQIRLSMSKDGGLTWKETTVVDPVGNPGQIFPVIALDDVGGLYAAWAVEEGGRDVVKMSYSSNDGATWSTPQALNAAGTSGVLPWIDVTSPGHVAVAWYQTDSAVLSGSATGKWYVQMATSTNAISSSPSWTVQRVWSDAIHKGPICTLGVMCTGGRQLLDFFQVRVGTDGYPALVFADTQHGSGVRVYFTKQTSGSTL